MRKGLNFKHYKDELSAPFLTAGRAILERCSALWRDGVTSALEGNVFISPGTMPDQPDDLESQSSDR